MDASVIFARVIATILVVCALLGAFAAAFPEPPSLTVLWGSVLLCLVAASVLFMLAAIGRGIQTIDAYNRHITRTQSSPPPRPAS